MLTEREWATVSVLACLAFIALRTAAGRASVWNVVKAFLAPRLVWLFVGFALVAAAYVYLGWLIGLWEPVLLKDTLLVAVAVGASIFSHAVRTNDGPSLMKRTGPEADTYLTAFKTLWRKALTGDRAKGLLADAGRA